MIVKSTYPVRLSRQSDSSILVSFDDIPEALTEGETVEEAIAEAQDCLLAALGGYIREKRKIPLPSKPAPGQEVIPLSVLTSAKLALYRSILETGITMSDLAERLHMRKEAVERLIDPDERSDIDRIDEALSALGKRIEIGVRDAA